MDLARAPDYFYCPLSSNPRRMMRHPVTVESGVTYDRESILAVFARCTSSRTHCRCAAFSA